MPGQQSSAGDATNKYTTAVLQADAAVKDLATSAKQGAQAIGGASGTGLTTDIKGADSNTTSFSGALGDAKGVVGGFSSALSAVGLGGNTVAGSVIGGASSALGAIGGIASGVKAIMSISALFIERGGIIPSAAGGMIAGGGTLSILHPQEMVLPAPISRGMQGLIARGNMGGPSDPSGGFGGDVHVHLGAGGTFLDGPSVNRWFTNSGGKRMIVDATRGAIRTGTSLSMRNMTGPPSVHNA